MNNYNWGKCKVSEILPFLAIIANQNGLKLSHNRDFKQCKKMLNASLTKN